MLICIHGSRILIIPAEARSTYYPPPRLQLSNVHRCLFVSLGSSHERFLLDRLTSSGLVWLLLSHHRLQCSMVRFCNILAKHTDGQHARQGQSMDYSVVFLRSNKTYLFSLLSMSREKEALARQTGRKSCSGRLEPVSLAHVVTRYWIRTERPQCHQLRLGRSYCRPVQPPSSL